MFNESNVIVNGGADLASTLQTYKTVVLKYNIVDGHNLLTQAMVSHTNTKYVIKWDYELAEDITIPANCVLQFDGGTISGEHTITGQNTGIQAGLVKIFSIDVNLAGSWNVVEGYPEWFGSSSDADNINKALLYFYNVVLQDKQYIIDKVDSNGYGITLGQNRTLRGKRIYENTSGASSVIKVQSDIICNAAVFINKCCLLEDISIVGNGADEEKTKSCVKSAPTSRCTLNRVAVATSYFGFDLQLYLSTIIQCTASYTVIGFFVHGSVTGVDGTVNSHFTSINLNTCYAVDCYNYGYYIMGMVYSSLNNCAADGCGMLDNVLTSSSFIGYSYCFYGCRGITMNACGQENALRALRLKGSQSIIVNTPNFLFGIPASKSVDGTFAFTSIINIDYCLGIQINRPVLAYSDYLKNNYITDNSRLIRLYGAATNNIMITFINGYTEPILKYSNFYTEGSVTLDSLQFISSHNVASNTEVSKLSEILPYLNGYKIIQNPNMSFSISASTYDVSYSPLLEYKGTIIIEGNNKTQELFAPIRFSQGTFVIRNLTIKSHSSLSSLSSIFIATNGANVILESCTIICAIQTTDYALKALNGGKFDCRNCIVAYVGSDKSKFGEAQSVKFVGLSGNYSDVLSTTKIFLPYGKYIYGPDNNGLVIQFSGSNTYKGLINDTLNIPSTALSDSTFLSVISYGCFDGCRFLDENGIYYRVIETSIIPEKGSSNSRPTTKLIELNSDKTNGFEYYDETLMKPIYWDKANTGWVDATGATV